MNTVYGEIRDSDDWQTRDTEGNNRGTSVEALAASFQNMVKDAEDLLRATANYSAEGFAAARARFQRSLEDAKVRMSSAQSVISEKAGEATAVTERYVSENPWKALAIVGSIGVILGLLMSRR